MSVISENDHQKSRFYDNKKSNDDRKLKLDTKSEQESPSL